MARKLLAFTIACDGAMTTEGYFEMRYLLNTLVSLTIVLIGFALAQPARAFIINGVTINGDTTAPTITDLSMSTFEWFVDESVSGTIFIEVNENMDPSLYDVTATFSTDGPIVIAIETITLNNAITLNNEAADTNGFFDISGMTAFSYTPNSVFGLFSVFVTVTDAAGYTVNGATTYTIKPIPEPAAISLFAVGLAGLGFLMRRRRNGRRQT